MATPYRERVTSDYPRASVDLGLLRDVLAVVLILFGIAGLVFVGFHVPWQVNVGLVSVAMIAAGVFLGYER